MYQKMQNNPPENVAVELSQPDDGNQHQVQVSEFANLEAGLKSIFGADFNLADERSQQMLLAHLKLNFDQKKRLADAIEADPRLGQMLADMVSEVNMSDVSLEERLSNQVYFYDKDLRKISMATDTPNRRLDGIVAEEKQAYKNQR